MLAIVYESNAGHTKAYAQMLGRECGIRVFDISQAKSKLAENADIIFMGWVMACNIKGYKEVVKIFNVKAVCSVGMSKGDAQKADIQKINAIPEDVPLFCLQGGFELDKLHGIYKIMMTLMRNGERKRISALEKRTEEDEELIDIWTHGANKVSKANLANVCEWYREHYENQMSVSDIMNHFIDRTNISE